MIAFGQPAAGWNPLSDLRQLLEYPFMVHAFVAGTIVSVVAALVGWFMVLRRQTFAGHTLALVGFPGAAGAALIGISPQFGYFGFCVAAALVIAAVPRSREGSYDEEPAIVGTTQAFALGCGYLFATLYRGSLSGVNGLLFGSFLGITSGQVVLLGAFGALVVVVLAGIGRPLLFASVDPEAAASRGVPVGALSVLFLVLLGIAAAEASQITGSLLVFALLVLPAATARVLTARPVRSVVATVVIGLLVTWGGLALAYFTPWPIGFWVTTLAFGIFLVATAWHRVRGTSFTLRRYRDAVA